MFFGSRPIKVLIGTSMKTLKILTKVISTPNPEDNEMDSTAQTTSISWLSKKVHKSIIRFAFLHSIFEILSQVVSKQISSLSHRLRSITRRSPCRMSSTIFSRRVGFTRTQIIQSNPDNHLSHHLSIQALIHLPQNSSN